MLFASPEIQNISNAKTDHQLDAVGKRINEISTKLTKASLQDTSNAKNAKWDWAASYSGWSEWEDIDELSSNKLKEEKKLDGILNKKESLGHYHDHSKERAFFELSEDDKLAACEENRKVGNYLYKEGVYPKAAEHFQIAIAYYEYCFPDEKDKQELLDDLRRACLCNISLCYQNMGYLRQAVEAASTVLKETNGTHCKALFRRAQARRLLDEYE